MCSEFAGSALRGLNRWRFCPENAHLGLPDRRKPTGAAERGSFHSQDRKPIQIRGSLGLPSVPQHAEENVRASEYDQVAQVTNHNLHDDDGNQECIQHEGSPRVENATNHGLVSDAACP